MACQRLDISPRIRREILDSGPCAYCGDLFPSEVDHIIPVARGGASDLGNLAPSCTRCNRDKTGLLVEDWKAARLRDGCQWPPRSLRDFTGKVVSFLTPGTTAMCARSQAPADALAQVIWRLAGRTHELLDQADPAVVAAAAEVAARQAAA